MGGIDPVVWLAFSVVILAVSILAVGFFACRDVYICQDFYVIEPDDDDDDDDDEISPSGDDHDGFLFEGEKPQASHREYCTSRNGDR